MSIRRTNKKLPYNPNLALLHFLILECLMRGFSFRTSSFSLLSMSGQILHLTIFIFLFGPHIGLDQGNLTTRRSWKKLFISHSNLFGLFFFGSLLLGFDIWFINSNVGVDSKTNKFLPFIVAKDVGDNEEGAKLVEMLGDSLSVWFVAKSNIVEVEKKRWNLKFYGGFKGVLSTTTIINLIRK